MNKKRNSWENWEKEWENKHAKESLEKTKSGSIAFVEDKDKWTRWEIYHARWETYLTSDYWKNWREKINSFESKKEVCFYTSKLWTFIDFVKDNTQKDIHVVRNDKPWDPKTTPKLIEQELKRLENISEEEFNKTDKWRNSVKWRELSTQEVSNDPWFNKQINILFGLENEKLPKEEKTNGEDYKSWTKEQLISEINRLKAEIENLKNNQTLTSSERQTRLQYNQQRLDQIQSFFNPEDTQYPTNNIPFTSLFIGVTLLALIALISFLVIKKHRKNK